MVSVMGLSMEPIRKMLYTPQNADHTAANGLVPCMCNVIMAHCLYASVGMQSCQQQIIS